MKKFGALVGVFAVALLVGCGPAQEQAPAEQGEAQNTGLTQEQLEKIQASVPVPDAQMVQAFATACQPTNTNSCVNAGYGACTGWSAVQDCGELTVCDPDVVNCKVRICDPDGYCYNLTTGTQWQGRNRYRVCSNAAGETCTEFEKTNRLVCGCGGNGEPW